MDVAAVKSDGHATHNRLLGASVSVERNVAWQHVEIPCSTPTADMGSGLRDSRQGRQGQRRGGQTSETGLIGPQKAIKSPSALPENVNKVMVDKDQKACATKLLKTETSAGAAPQRA